jgi:hypothetical protein
MLRGNQNTQSKSGNYFVTVPYRKRSGRADNRNKT